MGEGCLREREFGDIIPGSPQQRPAKNRAGVETPRFPKEVGASGSSGDEAGRWVMNAEAQARLLSAGLERRGSLPNLRHL